MYCPKCGGNNPDQATFCTHCGQALQTVQTPQREYAPPPRTGSPMRTTTLILGLIAATMLFFGGCTAYVTGSFFQAGEEVFGTEFSDSDDGTTSTTADVAGAGLFAVVIAILLFVAGGLARVALKTSLILLILAMPMLIGLVVVDTTSLFAAFYYLAIVLIGASVVLMIIAYLRSKQTRHPT